MRPTPWLALALCAACAAPRAPREVVLDLSEGNAHPVSGPVRVREAVLGGSDAPMLFTEDGSPLAIDLTLEVPARGRYRPELRDVTVHFFRITSELRLDGESLGVIVEERETSLSQREPLHTIQWPALELPAGASTFSVIAPEGELSAESLALVPVEPEPAP